MCSAAVGMVELIVDCRSDKWLDNPTVKAWGLCLVLVGNSWHAGDLLFPGFDKTTSNEYGSHCSVSLRERERDQQLIITITITITITSTSTITFHYSSKKEEKRLIYLLTKRPTRNTQSSLILSLANPTIHRIIHSSRNTLRNRCNYNNGNIQTKTLAFTYDCLEEWLGSQTNTEWKQPKSPILVGTELSPDTRSGSLLVVLDSTNCKTRRNAILFNIQ